MVNTIGHPSLTPKPKKIGQRRRWLFVVLTILAITGLSGSAHFYAQYRNIKTNPDAVAQREIEEVVATVGKLMLLPVDETPTVATISDQTKLTDQTFFQSAKNGDKLLVYSKASTAILYRPDINKIINVTPIVDEKTSASAPTNTDDSTTNTNSQRE